MSVKNYKIYEVIGKCVELLDSIDLRKGSKEIKISECGPTIELKSSFNLISNDIKEINMSFYENYVRVSLNKSVGFSCTITTDNIDIQKPINLTATVGFMYEELNSANDIKNIIEEFLKLYGVVFIKGGNNI